MKPAQLTLYDLIGERLSNISTDNGYHTDPEKIIAEQLNNFTGETLPIIYYWLENDSFDKTDTSSENRNLPLTIAYFNRSRDNSPIEESYNLAFDIYTAIHRNPDAPKITDLVEHDLGLEDFVNSINVDITPVIGKGQTPYVGAILAVAINYHIYPGHMSFEVC